MRRNEALILALLTTVISSCGQKDPSKEINWILVEGGEFQMGMNDPLVSPGGDTIYGFTSPAHKVG